MCLRITCWWDRRGGYLFSNSSPPIYQGFLQMHQNGREVSQRHPVWWQKKILAESKRVLLQPSDKMLPGYTFLQFIVATVLETKSEPGRRKRRYKGCPKWSRGSGPNSNMHVYVVVLVSHTAKQFSGPAGCPAIQLNADIIYMEGALVSTG